MMFLLAACGRWSGVSTSFHHRRRRDPECQSNYLGGDATETRPGRSLLSASVPFSWQWPSPQKASQRHASWQASLEQIAKQLQKEHSHEARLHSSKSSSRTGSPNHSPFPSILFPYSVGDLLNAAVQDYELSKLLRCRVLPNERKKHS